MTDLARARTNMIESQLRPNNVTDERILKAIRATPRELFVPAARRGIAYIDEDIDIGHGRCLIEPMVFGRMLEQARVGPDDIVLDVACGTGYSAAVLARLADTVVAVEDVPELAAQANEIMTDLAIGNAVVVKGVLPEGRPGEAPFDVILIDGAVAAIPAALIAQLGEGGRLVTVERPGSGAGRITLLVNRGGAISRYQAFDASTPVLAAFSPEPGFVF
jgi:protein-L-isoaspartate(D-aspartate) O-methyltransferase